MRFKVRGQASSLQSSRPASTMPSTSRERVAMVSKSTISSETLALVREAHRYSLKGVHVTVRRPQTAKVASSPAAALDNAPANRSSESARDSKSLHPKLTFEDWMESERERDLRFQQSQARGQLNDSLDCTAEHAVVEQVETVEIHPPSVTSSDDEAVLSEVDLDV